MNGSDRIPMKRKALWVAEAFGIVLAYFGAFAVLMYLSWMPPDTWRE